MNQIHKMQDDDAREPWSLEAWQEATTQVATFEVHGKPVGVKYRTLDVSEFLLASEDGVGNPILAELQKALQIDSKALDQNQFKVDVQALLSAVFSDGVLPELKKRLDRYLIEAVVAPPLVEQGHKDGLPVRMIPTQVKLEIFFAQFGGWERVQALATFQQGQAASMVARPTGKKVRDDAK